jgi:CHAP domain-containing protein
MKIEPLNNRKRTVLVIVIIFGLALGFAVFYKSKLNFVPQILGTLNQPSGHIAFPDTSSDQLSADQQKIITILKQEYLSQPQGTKYSQGVEEPWCADFVSWVFKQADMPFSNPNSGSWRIPGTHTLREYYESRGRFKSSSSGYSPNVGDTMIYDNPSPFGQHVNVVIENKNSTITTIGGNEPGGIRIMKHEKPDNDGFVGYGTFN